MDRDRNSQGAAQKEERDRPLWCIAAAKFLNGARRETNVLCKTARTWALGLRPQHLCLIPKISGQNIPSNGLLEQKVSGAAVDS